MQYGPNGNPVTEMNWEQYKKWQRWDEWPERKDNPPLTVETVFWYDNSQYMVTTIQSEYQIVSLPEFTTILQDKNLISLLNLPFVDGQSFKDMIGDFLFEN